MKFGIIGNVQKPGLAQAVSVLIANLEDAEMDYVVDEQILPLLHQQGTHLPPLRGARRNECASDVDMLVAFGGDGTILSAARLVGSRGTPILGVNLGKLGFLAELSSEDMHQEVGDIIKRQYVIEERMVLVATSPQISNRRFCGLNDIVLDKSSTSRVITLEVYINGAFAVTYRCDGLIISTPTGSTAYALSNGGPIVTPTSTVIGITPISPHTLSGRPFILPDTSSIQVVAASGIDEILVSADGQEEAVIKPPLDVTIKKADYCIKLVKRVGRSYFDVLRAKLLWGKDATSI